jgi:RecA-family ATPase
MTINTQNNSYRTMSKLNPEAYRLEQKEAVGTTQTPSGSFEAYSYGDLHKMNFTASPWLFEGLMRCNEVGMIYAATGVGKTWLTLALAMVAAGGGTVLKWQNTTPRKVLYLDGEMDAGDLVDRVNKLSVGLGCDPVELKSNLIFLPRQLQSSIAGDFLQVEQESSQLGILEYAKNENIELIIIDNLTTMSGQVDENSSQEMKAFNGFLLRAKQRGVALLVVHHSGKGQGAGPRGSSAIMATLNLLLKLEASTSEKAANDQDTKFTVVFEKNRNNVDMVPVDVKITKSPKLFDDDNNDQILLILDPDSESLAKRVARLLKTKKYKTQIELGTACVMSQGAISKQLKECLRLGVLEYGEADELFAEARRIEGCDEIVDF